METNVCNFPGNNSLFHNWRLYSREYRTASRLTSGPVGNPGWQEVWYCTQCRKIDERTDTAVLDHEVVE